MFVRAKKSGRHEYLQVAQHVLDRAVRLAGLIVLASSRGAAQIDPVGGAITGAAEATAVDEGLQEVDRMSVDPRPVLREPTCHAPQKVGGQMRDLHPRQNQIAKVVGNEPNVLAASLGRPADEAVPAAQVTWRRGPRHAGDGPTLRVYQVLEVLADRLRVAEVVVLLKETVEKRLIRRPPHLAKGQRPQRVQDAAQRRGVDGSRRGSLGLGQRIGRDPPLLWQLDVACPVQGQHQPASNHVSRGSIGLDPIPGLADLLRQCPSAGRRMFGDQFVDERHVGVRDDTASVFQLYVHGPQRSTSTIGT